MDVANNIDSSRNAKSSWNFIARVRQFFTDVVGELKKVTWTTKRELIDSTIVVFVSIFFMAAIVGVLDYILTKMLDKLIR